MGRLDDLIYGVRDLFDGAGVQLPRRAKAKFSSAFSLVDNAITKMTEIDVTPSALQGSSAGVLLNTADVVRWEPESVAQVVGYTVAGSTATNDADATDLIFEVGDPAIEIDYPSFVVQAAALISARKGAADFATYRVSRTFARTASGAVTEASTSADDGKVRTGTADSTPWPVPVVAWDAALKFPKITVETDEVATVYWRAVLAVAVFVG